MKRRTTGIQVVVVSLALGAGLFTAPAASADVAEFSFVYGNPGDIGVMGDWDGNGTDTPGVIRGDTWWLSNDFNANVARTFKYGVSGDQFVAGDWNGDGIDTPGVVRGNTWYLSDSFGGSGDHVFTYGNPGDFAVVGDWDADGTDRPGVIRNGVWWLSNGFDAVVATSFPFGLLGDKPVVGDWDNDGRDTPGVVRSAEWFISNGLGDDRSLTFVYGYAGDRPLAGDFNGDGSDTFGVQRDQWWYMRNTFPEGSYDPTVPMSNNTEVYASGSTGDRTLQGTQPIWATLAPMVRLHPDETAFPASPGWFINNSRLSFSRENALDHDPPEWGVGRLDWGKLGKRYGTNAYFADGHYAWEVTRPWESGRASDLSEQDGFFLNLVNDFRGGQTNLGGVPVYYEYPRSGEYIQYWFFYAYNRTFQDSENFSHEGDWERIAIDLENGQPKRVAYYRHNCEPVVLPWSGIEKVDGYGNPEPNGTHPVTYSALGRHGNYAFVESGSKNHCAFGLTYDTVGAGTRWRTWNRMASLNSRSWYNFGGAWGEVSTKNTTGPLAPYPQRKLPPDSFR